MNNEPEMSATKPQTNVKISSQEIMDAVNSMLARVTETPDSFPKELANLYIDGIRRGMNLAGLTVEMKS